MTPNVARYLNKTVFVSIPKLFEDGMCRPYRLLGAEMNGLWLQSDELTRRLLPEDKMHLAALAPAVFVPFAHIAGVLIASGLPPSGHATTQQEAADVTTSRTNQTRAGQSRRRQPNQPESKDQRNPSA